MNDRTGDRSASGRFIYPTTNRHPTQLQPMTTRTVRTAPFQKLQVPEIPTSCDGCAYAYHVNGSATECRKDPPICVHMKESDGQTFYEYPECLDGCSHYIKAQEIVIGATAVGIDQSPMTTASTSDGADAEITRLREGNARLLLEIEGLATRCRNAEADRDSWQFRAEHAEHWIESAREPIANAVARAKDAHIHPISDTRPLFQLLRDVLKIPDLPMKHGESQPEQPKQSDDAEG